MTQSERGRKMFIESGKKEKFPMERHGMLLLNRIFHRFLLLCLLWWVLTEGYPGSWWFGLPGVTVTTVATLGLSSRFTWHWRPLGMIRFVPFFFLQSLHGGIDVAWRALHRQTPMNPALFDFPLRLPHGPARVFLANTVSLLPGTCSADLSEECLKVHVLDGSIAIHTRLQAVEEHVAALFGLSIPPAERFEEASPHE